MYDAKVFYPIDVHLLDTVTGERMIHHDAYGYDEEDPPGVYSDFMWSEGNYACDCNRGLFFERARGKEVVDSPCGSGRFVVEKIIRLSDGKTVYSEI